MTNITIYDYDAERIEEISERFDLSEHEIIELLLDEVSSMTDSEKCNLFS